MPNEEYLDASVHWKVRTGHVRFAEPTHVEVAEAIKECGLATEVGRRIGSGKEADVYLARDRGGWIAIKVYRQYRSSHRGGGPIKLETMGQRATREYEMQFYAWQGGARVPRPIERVENMFSMQYLGSAEGPAPMLQKVRLPGPEAFLHATVEGIEALAEAGVVHSDLSPFNILVHEEKPWFIDLAAAVRVDRLGSPPWQRMREATESLERGVTSLGRYFARYGLELDGPDLLRRSRRQYARYGVEG